MKSHIQKGDIITVPDPAGGIASGERAIVGNIFGIAAYSAAVGDPLELAITGVYQLPKATAAVLTVGARVAWDNTTKNIITPCTRCFPAGVATQAAGNCITSVAVGLDSVGIVAA